MAFHPYPQLIPSVFNLSGFGPPRGLTRASTWPWVDHSASGLESCDSNALFGLAFATASPRRVNLATQRTNSQAHSSKGTPSPQQVKAPTDCRHTVSGTISLPSPGYFSPFPHGTCPLSVTREYLGLGGGPPRFTAGFLGPACYLGFHPQKVTPFSSTGVAYPLRRGLSHDPSTMTQLCNFLLPARSTETNRGVPRPPIAQRLSAITRDRFSLIRFRSPLLTESRLLSLPAGTEMFHFPAFPPQHPIYSGAGDWTRLQPGFPIRKSSNHSSVANSSRLIAGSYVLHRLLVPRHPPCALTNFHNTLHKIAQIQRCSRPLYSSQATGSPRPTPNHRTFRPTPKERGPDSLIEGHNPHHTHQTTTRKRRPHAHDAGKQHTQ